MVWIDYKKTFDNLLHSWIEMFGAIQNIRNFQNLFFFSQFRVWKIDLTLFWMIMLKRHVLWRMLQLPGDKKKQHDWHIWETEQIYELGDWNQKNVASQSNEVTYCFGGQLEKIPKRTNKYRVRNSCQPENKRIETKIIPLGNSNIIRKFLSM